MEKRIYTMDIEFQTREEIKRKQEELLCEQMRYLQAHSPFYRQMFADKAINIADIHTIEDLQCLPFTEKKDLQLHNREFLCVPREEVVDFITTSGTLGEPVTFACSEHDLQRLAYNEKKSFACAGLSKGDVLQLMTTMDKRFMAGIG